jgi:hypothetical protein
MSWTAVPETTVHEDSDTTPWKNQIGSARKSLVMGLDDEPATFELFPQEDFRLGMARFLEPHSRGDPFIPWDRSISHEF